MDLDMGQGCQRPGGIQLGGLGSTQQGREGRGESGDVSGLSSGLLAAMPTQTEEGGEEGAGVWQAGTFGVVTSEAPSGRQVGVIHPSGELLAY